MSISKKTGPWLLSWPEEELEWIVEKFDSELEIVYGAGRYHKGLFIIRSRYMYKNHTVSDDIISVPEFYGKHLEHLCYQYRYYSIVWIWMREEYFKNDDVIPAYRLAVETIAKTRMYHSRAIILVMKEV